MANNFFQFKQFTVHQQHCAMKVCTDACLFGAWAGSMIAKKLLQKERILDIGTGTGLLSLMLAQQLQSSIIDAIEIDAAAATQAADNFASSPWHHHLKVFHTSIQSFHSSQPYNFIISNPPFFKNDLASHNAQRNVALHSHQLSLEELLAAIQQHLAPNGHFAVLLPFHRSQSFEILAKNAGFFVQEKTVVHQTPTHAPFRSMLLFGTAPQNGAQSSITIKDAAGNYTNAFVTLLKDYYLYL